MSTTPGNDPEFKAAVRKPRPAWQFSILGVLGVVAILVLLAALLFPTRRDTLTIARRAQCVNNLKQICLALYNYETEYKALPPAYTVDASGKPLHSWRTLILPFLHPHELYKSIDLTKPWNDPANAKAFEAADFAYHCPDAPWQSNKTTYLAIVGPNACFLPDKPRRMAEITDPHESTLCSSKPTTRTPSPGWPPLMRMSLMF